MNWTWLQIFFFFFFFWGEQKKIIGVNANHNIQLNQFIMGVQINSMESLISQLLKSKNKKHFIQPKKEAIHLG